MHLFLLVSLVHSIKSQDVSQLVDTKTLSELPLDRLLKVRSTFKMECPKGEENDQDEIEGRGAPEALPLQSKHLSRGSYGGGADRHHEDSSKKSGKKSVQSIFQISVTTLAFLAFGGYLLCLIVQAIKGKEGMNMNMDMGMNEMIAIIKRPNRRRPPNRRPTRRPVRVKRPNRRPNTRHKREDLNVWPDVNPEKMYEALIMLSEGYTHYHTMDYGHFNYSNSYFV